MKVVALAFGFAIVAGSPRAHARGCSERSDVVGLQHCSRFGEWSRDTDFPRLWFDIGYFHHTYQSQPFTLATDTAAMSTLDAFATTARGFVLRSLFGFGHVFYAGSELEIGAPEVHVALDPSPSFDFYAAPSAIAGVHVDALRVAVSAELAFGFRHESFTYCPDKGCAYVENVQNRGVIEARLGVDVFLMRHWTIGVKLGKSLIDADDTTVMVVTGGHIRPMDGM